MSVLLAGQIFFPGVNAAAQSKGEVFNQATDRKTKIVTDLILYLEAHEDKGVVEIGESCLVLLSALPVTYNLPFSRGLTARLAAGTKYYMPPGVYPVKNPNDFAVWYQLLPAANCGEN